jgi:NADH:ubiquinone oxidoreductase subunit 3 (subunit A)
MAQGLELLIFLVISTLAALSLLVGAKLFGVRAKKQHALKHQTYECGEADTGVTWVRFHARYYVVALFFVLFDIEAAFLYPWGTIVRELGVGGLGAIFSFVAVLMLGWLWASRKGALEWQ